jgi:Protein of unknown function (DUF3455)
MTRLTRLCRTVGVGLAVATATLTMTQVANAKPAQPGVPPALAVPADNEQFLVGHGKGVQIYQCQSVTTNGTTTFSWTFVKPQATLTTDNGQVITHFVGPTWKASDGSEVTGKAVAKDPVDPLPADAKDIQQLLLKATPVVPGILGATTYIQRLNTKGGTQPPTAECKAQTAGKVKEVPYKADYVFFKATAAKPA